MEDRALLVAAYWRTNLTMQQLAPPFGVSKSAAARIIDQLGPMLAIRPRKRFAKDTVLIVDGTLVPTRDHTIAAQSEIYRYSTHHQVMSRVLVRMELSCPGLTLPARLPQYPATQETAAQCRPVASLPSGCRPGRPARSTQPRAVHESGG